MLDATPHHHSPHPPPRTAVRTRLAACRGATGPAAQPTWWRPASNPLPHFGQCRSSHPCPRSRPEPRTSGGDLWCTFRRLEGDGGGDGVGHHGQRARHGCVGVVGCAHARAGRQASAGTPARARTPINPPRAPQLRKAAAAARPWAKEPVAHRWPAVGHCTTVAVAAAGPGERGGRGCLDCIQCAGRAEVGDGGRWGGGASGV